ncbi:MAG: NAD(P)H:quinone oxidoreductase [Proteobacteria bacterium]|nr:NAD(P)H:quinone oxidoreductase [Pseudomonadota bacterium]
MPKVLVLYYSTYGHIAQMADAVAEGARSEGAHVDIRRVPDLEGTVVARPETPQALIDELADYDAIVIGTGTRFGRMSAPMAAFLDQAGALWATGKLNGKVGAAFTSTATQHGGQETTLFSIITNLLHFGLTVVGLDYGYAAQMGLDEVVGGAPYGATTIAGGRGERQPSEADLGGARYLGARVARTAAKLFG